MVASCATCAAGRECHRAFGMYWAVKSRGGIGCDHPIEQPETKTGNEVKVVMRRMPTRPKKMIQGELGI